VLRELVVFSFLSAAAGVFAMDAKVDLKDFKLGPEAWTPRDAATSSVSTDGDSSRFEIKAGAKGWLVFDGPVVEAGKRSKFCQERVFKVSLEAKASGLEGYSGQLRLRQGKSGRSFTRNLAPHSLWETTVELPNGEKCQQWTKLEGSSSASSDCDVFVMELWVAAPKSGEAASLSVKALEIKESYSIAHLVKPEPWTQGSIFFADKGSMKVEFVNPETLKSCKIELFDEEGRKAGLVEGAAKTPSLSIPLDGKGFYSVKASADYEGSPSIETGVTAAVVGPALPSEVRVASRLGSMRCWAGGDIWSKSGANWDWGIGGINLRDYTLSPDGQVKPPEGWKPLKTPTDSSIVLTVGSFPKWVMPKSDGNSLYPPSDWKAFEALFEAFAKANPDLKYFCPFNEPDAHWRGGAEDFVRFHKAIRDGVKRGNPEMKVYGPCMYSIRLEDFKKYADLGLLEALDGIVMHAYVNGSAPEAEFMDNVLGFVEYLKSKGKGDWPVYVTEFGWCTGTGDWQKTIPELSRSRYVARSISLFATQPVDCIEYFVFKYTGSLTDPGYSLLFKDDSPTPSYVSFVNTLNWLSWTKRGDGRWFRISPELNLALFDNGSKAVAAVWGSSGGSVRLPALPIKGEDMMGRPLPPPEGTLVSAGESPSFYELDSNLAFKNMDSLPLASFAPGGSMKLSWTPFILPPGLFASGSVLSAAPDAKPGEYLVIGESGGKWQAQPVKILAPLTLQSSEFPLSSDAKSLCVSPKLVSSVEGSVEALVKVKLEDGRVFEAKGVLKKGVPSSIPVSIPDFQFGRRYKGSMEISLLGSVPWRIERSVDQTVMACGLVAEDGLGGVDWSSIPSIDFSKWGPWPRAISETDCSASLKTAVSEKGFHLRVEVQDDVHWQGQTPGGMWQEDSIQVAFDVDADKEWQPNNVGNGFNGHRILEYGVAHPSKGGPAMVWRYRADAPDFKSGCPEPKVAASVKRKDKTTLYEVFLPWETLALQKAPAPGSNIGFALLVNDADKTGDRHCLKLFDGILGPKDPELFGKLRVVEEAAPQAK